METIKDAKSTPNVMADLINMKALWENLRTFPSRTVHIPTDVLEEGDKLFEKVRVLVEKWEDELEK